MSTATICEASGGSYSCLPAGAPNTTAGPFTSPSQMVALTQGYATYYSKAPTASANGKTVTWYDPVDSQFVAGSTGANCRPLVPVPMNVQNTIYSPLYNGFWTSQYCNGTCNFAAFGTGTYCGLTGSPAPDPQKSPMKFMYTSTLVPPNSNNGQYLVYGQPFLIQNVNISGGTNEVWCTPSSSAGAGQALKQQSYSNGNNQYGWWVCYPASHNFATTHVANVGDTPSIVYYGDDVVFLSASVHATAQGGVIQGNPIYINPNVQPSYSNGSLGYTPPYPSCSPNTNTLVSRYTPNTDFRIYNVGGTIPPCTTCGTCLNGGTYPNCVITGNNTCPTGQSGTYPTCGTCTNGATNYPTCTVKKSSNWGIIVAVIAMAVLLFVFLAI